MLLILAHLIGEMVEKIDKGAVVGFGAGNADGPGERWPGFGNFLELERRHQRFFQLPLSYSSCVSTWRI